MSQRGLLEKVPLLGLIAGDASYSLSPSIHNFSAKLLSKNMNYEGFSLGEKDLKDFLLTFTSRGGYGLNVSNPFKKKVLSFAKHSELFSANTLLFQNEIWKAYSTDGEGFWNGLERHYQSLDELSAFIFLGSGDVLPSLIEFMKPKLHGRPLHFIRRGQKNDKLLRSLYGQSHFHTFDPSSLARLIKAYEGKKLCLVQATSAPTKGDDLSEFVPALALFQGLFCDLVYSTPSKLFSYCESKRIPSLDGLPMLIEQALLSQKIWWGCSASYEDVFNFLEDSLGRKVS